MAQYKKRVNEIEDAIQKAKGFLNIAAASLGVSRSTLYRWIEGNPKLKEVVEESREVFLDVAESALMREIEKGNVTAIIFFLKTRGKCRGYSEKADDITDEEITVNVTF